jgi:hypothetical protein
MTDVFISPEADNQAMHTVRSAYDPTVVAIIKTMYMRTYEPATKLWRVVDSEIDVLTQRLEAGGHRVHRQADSWAAAVAVPTQRAEPQTAAGFFSTTKEDRLEAEILAAEIIAPIPESMRGAVFRAMGRQLYPDMFVSTRR